MKTYALTSLAFFSLVFGTLCCGDSAIASAEIIRRGELTVKIYAPKPGIGHGDGTPGGCTFTFKGTEYASLPMVKNGGKMFRCDVKPDSDEAVIRVAFYRPQDDWTCGTRFGNEQAKCLPDRYEAVGGILTARNGELSFEDHGFWDVSYDWGEHSVKFKDGREFDYLKRSWTGCGNEPQKFLKSGAMTVASGQLCNSDDWYRVYLSGQEVRPDGSGDHPFDSVGVNQDTSVPSATAWIGSVKGFIYLSKTGPVFKEVGNSPEFVNDGKAARWWSEDYQTRYTMPLSTEIMTSQTRSEVHSDLEASERRKSEMDQTKPLLTSDDLGKIEIDYKGRHGQFYLADLRKFDELKDIGSHPHKVSALFASENTGSVFYLLDVTSFVETPKIDSPCIGSLIKSIVWLRADADMIPREARSQVLSSCVLGRKQIGGEKRSDEKIEILFDDQIGRHSLVYNGSSPDEAFKISGVK